jgi:hypothetical protein
LRHGEGKSNKPYSWRQGLSHLLRIHRSTTNSNNNLAPSRKKGNSTSSNSSAPMGNSVERKTSAENNSNHGTPNKTRRNSNEVFYQEIETKWTAPPSPVHKCSKFYSLMIYASSKPFSIMCVHKRNIHRTTMF